jgi:pimeloyl-ACP methyl ester carboxylesterase
MPDASVPLIAATVILVHGAWADGSSWNKVIARLQEKGIDTIAVQNPLTSLGDDVAAVNRALESVKGPVVLVGHSWGGAVISQAGGDPKVKALVYVAAFAPDVGLSVNDLGKDAPPTPGGKEVVASPSGFLSISKKGIMEDFAQDLPKSESAILAATQGPTAAKAFDGKLTVAAWHDKPSWYVVSKQDRMIAPDGERAMAKAIKAHVSEVDASHVSMLSKPDAITTVIIEAIQSVPKPNMATSNKPR